tara:strand:+ start:100 stop:708 length:609 start_codon:yes stop_codon:yes gene_type:complete
MNLTKKQGLYKLNNRRTKYQVYKSQTQTQTQKSRHNLKTYKTQLTQFNTDLNKMIKSYEDGGIKVNKDHLNRSWKLAINNYKKSNYVKASKFLLLTLVTGSILLNRNKALTDSFGTSTKLSNSGGHMIMCGLLRSDAKNTSLFYKGKGKELSDRIQGLKNLSNFVKLGDGLNENTADILFDFIYTCQNPYLMFAKNTIASFV